MSNKKESRITLRELGLDNPSILESTNFVLMAEVPHPEDLGDIFNAINCTAGFLVNSTVQAVRNCNDNRMGGELLEALAMEIATTKTDKE